MKSNWLFFFIICLIALPLTTSSSFYIPEDTNYSIKFNCEIDGAVCTNTATCNVSIDFPNSSSLVDNQAASLISNARYNYTLNTTQTSTVGEDYSVTMTCYDGSVNGSQTVLFGINPSGIPPSEQRTETIGRTIWFVIAIGALLFVGFMFTRQSIPVKWTFFGTAIMFFLIAINLSLVSVQDEIINTNFANFVSGFTVISWILWWFIVGLLILMWIFTFWQTFFLRKNMNNAKRYGLA